MAEYPKNISLENKRLKQKKGRRKKLKAYDI